MKKLIGIVAVLIGLAFFTLLILRIWNIQIVEWVDVMRSGFSLIVLGIALLFLCVVYYTFFKEDRSYHKQSGKRAHPKY